MTQGWCLIMFTAGWHSDDTGAIRMTDDLLRSQWFVSRGSQSWEMNARRRGEREGCPGPRRCGERGTKTSANVGVLWWFCDNRSQYVTIRDTPSHSPQQLARTCSVQAAPFIPAPPNIPTIFLNTPDISYLWARWINILPPSRRENPENNRWQTSKNVQSGLLVVSELFFIVISRSSWFSKLCLNSRSWL